MATPWVIPLLAGLVSAFFAARVWGQWSERRRPHQLAWAVGLTMYATASLVDAYVAQSGWSVPLYRAYFTLAAANVGFLGLGTIFLARPGAWGRVFAVFVLGALALAAIGQLAVPLDAATPVTVTHEDGTSETRALADWGTEVGAKPIPMPNPGRVAFLLLNVVGGLALIVGAFVSWWRTRRAGVLLIGVGAMLPFLGGSLSTLFGLDLRTVLQLLGIVVMFAGYLRGQEARPPVSAPGAAEA